MIFVLSEGLSLGDGLEYIKRKQKYCPLMISNNIQCIRIKFKTEDVAILWLFYEEVNFIIFFKSKK